VLGTLSAARAAVKPFWEIHFPPNVDKFVETMCTDRRCFVDQSRDRITVRREAVWKPLQHWSHLICLAIYVVLSSADSVFLPMLLVGFSNLRTPTFWAVWTGRYASRPLAAV
jgi:hypothetical protein